MQEIKYEIGIDNILKTTCPYKKTQIGSYECRYCEFQAGHHIIDQVVDCTFDESFIGHCLLALNWQRGTEADIVKVLEAARESIITFEKYNSWLTLDDKQEFVPAFTRLQTAIKEPTDA